MKQFLFLFLLTLLLTNCNNEGDPQTDDRGTWFLDTGRIVVYPLNSDVATIDTVAIIRHKEEEDSSTWILKEFN